MAAAEQNSFCSRRRCQTLRECSFVRLLVLLSLSLRFSLSSPLLVAGEETRARAYTHPTCLSVFASSVSSEVTSDSALSPLSCCAHTHLLYPTFRARLLRVSGRLRAVTMTATCPLPAAAQSFVRVCPLQSFQAHPHPLYG